MRTGKNGVRRVAALVCSVALFATLLPVQVLAADEATSEPLAAVTSLEESGEEKAPEQGETGIQPETENACTKSEDCAAETHEEGCPKYVAPAEEEDTDPVVSCTKSEDCAAETHEEGCPKYVAPAEEEDTDPVVSCTKSEDCAAETHEEGCPKYVAPEEERIVAGSNLEVAITDGDMAAVTDETTAIAAALSRMQIEDVTAVTSLKVTTEGNAYLSPSDNEYIKSNFTALTSLDESECQCSVKNLSESYLTKSGLEDREYAEFGGLSKFSGLTALAIPKSAEVINSYSVDETGLNDLVIPDSVLVIESGAFSGNINFTGDIVIPDSVVLVGNNAFGLSKETAVDCGTLTLGDSLKYVDNNGFAHRYFTGNLIIPDSVEYIGNWVFTGPAFEGGTWTLGKGLKHIGDASLSNICSGNSGTLFVPARLDAQDTAFGYNTFSKVVFEEGITVIRARVIRNSTSVTEVVLPATVETIGTGAFSSCEQLSVVKIPDSVTTINTDAFNGTALNGVYLSASISSLGVRAFENLPQDSVIYADNDAVYDLLIVDKTNQWNRRYDSSKTALAVTNGGSFAADTQFTAGTLAIPTKNGAIFEGWYDNAEFTGEAVATAEAGKTYYAKWVDLTVSAISMQYGDVQAFPQIEGVVFTGWESADPSIVKITEEGIKAVGVGETTITSDAALARSGEKVTVTVNVAPRILTYTLAGGDTGSGSITYNYSGGHHALSDSMTIKWFDAPQTEVTLTEGTDINYTYTVEDPEAPDGGKPLTYDYLPMPVGEYTVSFNLKNPNYTFKLSDGTTSNTLAVKVNVTAEGTQRAYLASAAPKADQNFVYNGQGVLPVEGTLNAYAENDSSTSPVNIGTFTVNIEGLNGTSYHSEASEIAAGTDLSRISGLKLPTEPGTYIITASAANDNYYLYKSLVFTINKATVTITAADKTVIAGDEDGLPSLSNPTEGKDYTVTGLAAGHSLTTAPTLKYSEDANVDAVATYSIIPSGAAADEKYYTLQYVNGTLHVEKIAIIEGANQTWTKESGKDLVIRSNADFSDFLGVTVNDVELVQNQDYTAKSGSTIVTIKADYLNSLAAGDYKIAIVSNTGSAVTKFTVKAEAAGDSDTSNNDNTAGGNTGSTTTQSGSGIVYYTCPACGYHDWTAGADGYKCNHCGYVESVKQLSGYGNVKGVYEPKTSAAAAQSASATSSSAIPQTGDESQPLVWVTLVVLSGAALAGLAVYRKKRSDK